MLRLRGWRNWLRGVLPNAIAALLIGGGLWILFQIRRLLR